MTTISLEDLETRQIDPTKPLLEVDRLVMHYHIKAGEVSAVDNVSFTVHQGEAVGLVGESGCGKTSIALSLLRLLPSNAEYVSGEIRLNGEDLLWLSPEEMRQRRWKEIAMVFQGAMNSWNPVYRVGDQIAEGLRAHNKEMPKQQARARAVELLRAVGIPNPESRVDDHPHQFSGGMRQRAMIAMALANNPDVLIADEPTTALDVTIQAQIIELIGRLKDEFNSAVILITHDLGVVAEIADELLVMYAGRVVERGGKRQIFYDPQMPYTWGLLGSIPRLDRPKAERLHSIKGSPPSLINLPQGCKFRPRCPHAFEKCWEEPELENRVEEPGHFDRCWLPVEEKRSLREETISGETRAA